MPPMADPPRPRPASAAVNARVSDDWTVSGPRLGVKALCVRENEVLLIEEDRDGGSSFWTLPGGGVAPGESVRTSLRREVAEELQCRVTCNKAVGTCRYEHTTFGDVTTVYVVFECALTSEPVPNRAEDIVSSDWVGPGELPPGLLAPVRDLLTGLAADGSFRDR